MGWESVSESVCVCVFWCGDGGGIVYNVNTEVGAGMSGAGTLHVNMF